MLTSAHAARRADMFTIVAIIAVVFSNEEPTELADEAVLLIASANSSVSDAEIFNVPNRSLIYLRSLMNCFIFI